MSDAICILCNDEPAMGTVRGSPAGARCLAALAEASPASITTTLRVPRHVGCAVIAEHIAFAKERVATARERMAKSFLEDGRNAPALLDAINTIEILVRDVEALLQLVEEASS